METSRFSAKLSAVAQKYRVAIGALALYVALLLAVVLFRNYLLITHLVEAFTAVALGDAAIFALTFWQKARIQIGRRGLKFRTVRRAAAIATVVAIVPLLVRLMAETKSSVE